MHAYAHQTHAQEGVPPDADTAAALAAAAAAVPGAQQPQRKASRTTSSASREAPDEDDDRRRKRCAHLHVLSAHCMACLLIWRWQAQATAAHGFTGL